MATLKAFDLKSIVLGALIGLGVGFTIGYIVKKQEDEDTFEISVNNISGAQTIRLNDTFTLNWDFKDAETTDQVELITTVDNLSNAVLNPSLRTTGSYGPNILQLSDLQGANPPVTITFHVVLVDINRSVKKTKSVNIMVVN